MNGTPGRTCSDEHLPGLAVQSENEILAYCREVGTTIYHPSCSCRMGIDDRASFRASNCAAWKISRGRRRRHAGLVSGNTNAAIVMIAEKGSDMMLKDAR